MFECWAVPSFETMDGKLINIPSCIRPAKALRTLTLRRPNVPCQIPYLEMPHGVSSLDLEKYVPHVPVRAARHPVPYDYGAYGFI